MVQKSLDWRLKRASLKNCVYRESGCAITAMSVACSVWLTKQGATASYDSTPTPPMSHPPANGEGARAFTVAGGWRWRGEGMLAICPRRVHTAQA